MEVSINRGTPQNRWLIWENDGKCQSKVDDEQGYPISGNPQIVKTTTMPLSGCMELMGYSHLSIVHGIPASMGILTTFRTWIDGQISTVYHRILTLALV